MATDHVPFHGSRGETREQTDRADATKALRDKLANKRLPCSLPLRARLLLADGQHCSGCDLPMKVETKMWEMEFAGSTTIRLHTECEKIWRAETGN